MDFKEKLLNYGETFRDRVHGHKKIINTYASWFEDKENVESLALPSDCRHIIVGGEEDRVTAYEINRDSTVKSIDSDDFKSKHPEADTGVFHTLSVLLNKYEYPENRSFVIDCLTIALLEYLKIKTILDEKHANLYLKMHNRKVDASGNVAKIKKNRKTVKEKSVHNEDLYIDFRKVEEVFTSDEVFSSLRYPGESIGLISVLTGK